MDHGKGSLVSKWKLWHFQHGISFTSPAAGRQPLYPELDVARFLHSTAAGPAESQPADAAVTAVVSSAKIVAVAAAPPPSAGGDGEPASDGKAQTEASAKEEPEEDEDNDPGDPPVTDLDYNIPEDIFRAARLAEPGSPNSFWSYTLYRGPEEEDGAVGSKVKVHYCKSIATTERVCQYFLKEKVIGFDLEWLPSASKSSGERKNCSLVQLASASRIALFHVSLYPQKTTDLVAPSFRKIMEDPDILKVGVAIRSDCTRLRTYLGVQTMGQFELSHLYKQVKYHKTGEVQLINKRLVALARQVQDLLRLPMFKGQDVRASDWSRALNLDQIIYAASDAYAAVQLYAILEKQREELDPVPPRPYPAELGLPIRFAEGVTLPAADEAAEEVEEEVDDDKTAATLSPDFVASATDSIEIEVEADEAPATPKPAAPKKPSTPASKKPKDERYLAAEAWLTQYRSSHPKIRAAPSALRTYHIWHSNADLDPVAIAKLLREPPLQTNTVVSYILETIKMEKLPYNRDRLCNEVLALLPAQILDMRYKMLAKACGYRAATAVAPNTTA
ncbi:uncharacterized protein E0L32_010929 [Thyridium curvatum]|uniref:3'-5' exonuclease domain-containing protein n=1 Tax=Thyridium curvatum TaxID=1093900 RepID=A0A507AQG9_9PEZI|nr:uncharacterized protein E0L32_010929 [Thyridium curvatum]TPX07128.1 hypothetical protein E0L32_010929 [Thyridium curvatum]